MFKSSNLDTTWGLYQTSKIHNLHQVRGLSGYPVDLKKRKSSGTSCQIEIHFSIQITKFLMKYNLLCL